jgi:hypothetical protein
MQKADCIDTNRYSGVDNLLLSLKETQVKLRSMGDGVANTDAIVSRIRLCDLLLNEIRGIRVHLERGLHRRHPALRLEPVRRGSLQ